MQGRKMTRCKELIAPQFGVQGVLGYFNMAVCIVAVVWMCPDHMIAGLTAHQTYRISEPHLHQCVLQAIQCLPVLDNDQRCLAQWRWWDCLV